jgi:hypothetical protein
VFKHKIFSHNYSKNIIIEIKHVNNNVKISK